MTARTGERPLPTSGIRVVPDRLRPTLGPRALAAAAGLLVMAACSNPLAVQKAPDTLDHASSSASHTISSGNHTISSGNLAPSRR